MAAAETCYMLHSESGFVKDFDFDQCYILSTITTGARCPGCLRMHSPGIGTVLLTSTCTICLRNPSARRLLWQLQMALADASILNIG